MKKFSQSIFLILLINFSFFLLDSLLLKIKKTPKCKKPERKEIYDSTDRQILDNIIDESECYTDDGPYWISEDSFQKLKNKKFETIKIIDNTPGIKKKLFKSPPKNKLIKKIKKEIQERNGKILVDDTEDEDEDGQKKFKNKKYLKPLIQGKNATLKLIKTEGECKQTKSKIKNDINNNQSRLEELKRLIFVKTCSCKKHQNYKIKIRVSQVEKFFEWLFKGFKSVNGGYKITNGTDGKNSTIVYSENFDAKILCMSEKNSSIDSKNFEILKEKIYKIDYKKYKESMTSILRTLTKISDQLKNFCKGNEYGIDIISKYIKKINKDKLKNNLLDSVESMKNKAFSQLDKHSFEEAGYTLGKILGRGKIFGIWIYEDLENE
jgi:hypothetical protein